MIVLAIDKPYPVADARIAVALLCGTLHYIPVALICFALEILLLIVGGIAGSMVLSLQVVGTPATTADAHTYAMTTDPADPSSSSEEDDGDVSDAESQDDVDESASTVESKHEDEEDGDEPDVESSSGEDDAASDDEDFKEDEDVQEGVEEQSSDAESEKASPRRPSKEKTANEYYENPDLYGLRRSVGTLLSTLLPLIIGLIVTQ